MTPMIMRSVLAAAALALLAGCAGSTKPEQAPFSTTQSTPTTASTTPSTQIAAFTDPAGVAKVMSDAAHDVEVINSYDYRKLGQYLPGVKAIATPNMQKLLNTTYTKVLKPEAPKAHAVQLAHVNDTGIVSFDPATKTARVLVFGQITDTNTQATTPKVDAFGIVGTMKDVAGTWRIDAYATDTGSGAAATPPGTSELIQATSAAATEAAQVVTFRRASFSADFNKALAGTTGKLNADLAGTQAQTQSTLSSGKFDLTGKTDNVAVHSVQPQTVEVMVTLTSSKIADKSSSSTISTQRFILTMTKVGATWLASALESVAIS